MIDKELAYEIALLLAELASTLHAASLELQSPENVDAWGLHSSAAAAMKMHDRLLEQLEADKEEEK